MCPSVSTLCRGAVVMALLVFPGIANATGPTYIRELPADEHFERMSKAYQKKMEKYKDELSKPVHDPLPNLMNPKLCAVNGLTSYYRNPLDPVPDTCPVPLSKSGLRVHRRRPRTDQTPSGIIATSFDPSDPQNWAPWTNPPECGVNTNYCVFTSDVLPATGLGTFDSNGCSIIGGRKNAPVQGISIITTPETAAEDLNLHELALSPDSLGIFDVYANRPPAVDVRPHPTVKEKGEGVFATRHIRAGEVILLDRPALLAHHKFIGDAQARFFGTEEDDHGLGGEFDSDRARLWNTAVDRLPGEVAERIRRLNVLPRYKVLQEMHDDEDDLQMLDSGNGTKIKPNPPPTFSHAESIFASNSFSIDIQGFKFKGLFPNLAKFNHDCRPNVVLHASDNSMTMAAWAMRDIEEGEELTINYLGNGVMPSGRRKSLIERRWGFTCQCDLCNDKADDTTLFNSDERRKRLPATVAAMHRFTKAGRHEAALQAAKEISNIFIDEGLMRKPSTVEKMLELPSLPEEHAEEVNKALIADPFGPSELANTLASLYMRAGNYTEAIPQLRASLTELARRNFGWPREDDAIRMKRMMDTIVWMEHELKDFEEYE